jgi:hypothetical protein
MHVINEWYEQNNGWIEKYGKITDSRRSVDFGAIFLGFRMILFFVKRILIVL